MGAPGAAIGRIRGSLRASSVTTVDNGATADPEEKRPHDGPTQDDVRTPA